MKRLKELGICPKCGLGITLFKTSNYKRFAACEGCKTSYPLPRTGKISNSSLSCPLNAFPVLIVEKSDQAAYFWADRPCFSCVAFDKCKPIQELKAEFEELEANEF